MTHRDAPDFPDWEAYDNHILIPGIGAVEFVTNRPMVGDSSTDTALIVAEHNRAIASLRAQRDVWERKRDTMEMAWHQAHTKAKELEQQLTTAKAETYALRQAIEANLDVARAETWREAADAVEAEVFFTSTQIAQYLRKRATTPPERT